MKYTTVFRNKYQEYSLFMDEVGHGWTYYHFRFSAFDKQDAL